jgi:gliding motility-associated-like protein
MRILAYIVLFYLSLTVAYAQPAIVADYTQGTPVWDDLHILLYTEDKQHLIIAGDISTGDSIPAWQFLTYGSVDYVIAKTDLDGNTLWRKTFGGSKQDRLWAVIELQNGDLLLGGGSESPADGNKIGVHYGNSDYWLIRLKSDGTKIWERAYGGTGSDICFALQENPDGTILAIGSSDSDITGNKTTHTLGATDGWVVRIDGNGNILNQASYGSDSNDNIYKITPAEGGYLLGGAVSGAQSGTVSQNPRGESDYYVVKINQDGNYIWDKRYGGQRDEQIYAVKPTFDGGFLIVGGSASGVSLDKTHTNQGGYDYWIIKIAANGFKLWDRSIGGSALDVAYDVIEMPGGNFYVGGVSDSPAGALKKSPGLGDYDYWIAYFDKDGRTLWDKTYGGAASDAMTQMVLTPEYKLLIGGHSGSQVSSDKSDANIGYNDWWYFITDCRAQLELPTEKYHCFGAALSVNADLEVCPDGPCEFIWNRNQITSSLQGFNPALEGRVEVILRDRNGCVSLDTIDLLRDPNYTVFLGSDTTILKTRTIDLQPELNNFSGLTDFRWSNGSTSTSELITETGTYTVTVTDDAGCSATDSIYICVCGGEELYLANVVQPNDNLNNDVWFVQSAPGVVKTIRQVAIYNVWGSQMYFATDIPANDRNYGWDAKINNRPVPPGVYTYALQVEFDSGRVEQIYGTVTVVR